MLIVFKSVLYRIYATLLTLVVSYIVTRNIGLSLTISLIDNAFKVFTYIIFELFWKKVTPGPEDPCVILLTGISGSGKTTIANALKESLNKKGNSVVLLDGDEIRNMIKLDKFDKKSIINHNANIGYMASLFEKQGNIVIISVIAPYEEGRQKINEMCDRFFMFHISTPVEVCKERDPKGLYRKFDSGEIKNLAGVDSPYDIPHSTKRIDTSKTSIEDAVKSIINSL